MHKRNYPASDALATRATMAFDSTTIARTCSVAPPHMPHTHTSSHFHSAIEGGFVVREETHCQPPSPHTPFLAAYCVLLCALPLCYPLPGWIENGNLSCHSPPLPRNGTIEARKWKRAMRITVKVKNSSTAVTGWYAFPALNIWAPLGCGSMACTERRTLFPGTGCQPWSAKTKQFGTFLLPPSQKTQVINVLLYLFHTIAKNSQFSPCFLRGRSVESCECERLETFVHMPNVSCRLVCDNFWLQSFWPFLAGIPQLVERK